MLGAPFTSDRRGPRQHGDAEVVEVATEPPADIAPEAPWGAPVGRVATVSFAVGTLALVAYGMHRLPVAAWPFVLPNAVYEGLAAAFALFQTRGHAHASTPAEVVLPVVSTWLYPIASLVLGGHAVRHAPLAAYAALLVAFATYAWLIWAVLCLRRNFSILPEVRTLVTGGPYARLRHPLYLGYSVLWLVAAWQSGSLPLGALAVFSVLLFDRRAAMEERRLRAHVPAYASYMTQTWRLIPGTGRLAQA
jgi:protein-S-isoprenylcysteine O-methyltransferase Ste14